jgi:hypothetical protein
MRGKRSVRRHRAHARGSRHPPPFRAHHRCCHYGGVYSGTTARALRAALFALVCVGTGTALHQWADGCSPGTAGPALALPMVWLAAFGLARRERSPLFVTGALGVAQLCLHIELGWFCAPSSGSAAVPGMSGTAAVSGVAGVSGMPGMANMPGMPGMSSIATGSTGSALGHGMAAMLLAHLVAVAISGWWLGRGEQCFFELCRAVAFLAAPAVDLLRGRFPIDGAAPRPPGRRGIHITAPHTSSPPQGPAPGPRVVRGPPRPARATS